jgi:hypothetical protein
MVRVKTLSMVLALGLIVGLAGPVEALALPTSTRPTATQVGGVVVIPVSNTSGSALPPVLARAQAAGITKVRQEMANGGLLVARYEPMRPTGGPNFTVGLGWYIYIYLNRHDWIYLGGLSATAATAALCAWLLPTIGGAIACAVASFIIIDYVMRRTAPARGYCREFKFTYAGTFAGYKTVKRSC